jgi:hypothetical protein
LGPVALAVGARIEGPIADPVTGLPARGAANAGVIMATANATAATLRKVDFMAISFRFDDRPIPLPRPAVDGHIKTPRPCRRSGGNRRNMPIPITSLQYIA